MIKLVRKYSLVWLLGLLCFIYPDCATYATLNNAPLSANFIIFIAGLVVKTSVKEENVVLSFS